MDIKDFYKEYQNIDGWRMGTITDAMEEWCNLFSERMCVIYGDTKLSYKEMEAKIELAAVGFYNEGIRCGDRVILQLPTFLS